MKKASRENHFHYNPALQEFANYNRKNMTKSAASLWKYVLSGRNMMGYQFRRERPILSYIADFVCLDILLIIEVDGGTHEWEEQVINDEFRDKRLLEVGFTTLRFSSSQVLLEIEWVSGIIEKWIVENADVPPPGPRQRGKRK